MQTASSFKIFQILNLILQRYTKIPVTELIDNNLSISLLHPFNTQMKSLFNLSAIQEKLLNRNKQFILIILDYPKLLYLSQILEDVEDCVLIDTQGNQENNILLNNSNIKNQYKHTKGILIGLRSKVKDDLLKEQLDWYSSIVQLFHSHIHLRIYMFQAPGFECVKILLKTPDFVDSDDQDDFKLSLIPSNAYVKIFSERASKITIQQLEDICEVKKYFWGQVYKIEQGIDGLIIWLTKDKLPAMQQLDDKIKLYRNLIRVKKSQIGYQIFRLKGQLQVQLQQLQFTIYIVNMDSLVLDHRQKYHYVVKNQINKILEEFKQVKRQQHENKKIKEDIINIERLSQLLKMDKNECFYKFFMNI